MAKIERYFSRVAPSTQQPMANVNLGAENISRGSMSVARGVASIAGVLAEEGKRIGDTARTAWLVSETTKRDAENTRLLQDAKNTVITKESDIEDNLTNYRARAEATRKEIVKGAYDQKGAERYSNADIKSTGEMEGLLRAIYLENLSNHTDALTAETETALVRNGLVDELVTSREETKITSPWKDTPAYAKETINLIREAVTNNINNDMLSRNYSRAYSTAGSDVFTSAETEIARAGIKQAVESNASIDADTIKVDVNTDPLEKPDAVNAVYEQLKSLTYTDENGEQVNVYDSQEIERLSLAQKQAVIDVSTDIPFQLLREGRTGEAKSYVEYMIDENIITAQYGMQIKNQLTVATREKERKATKAELVKVENQSQEALTNPDGAVVGYETATGRKLITQEFEPKSERERADNYKAYFDMVFSGQLSFTDLANAAYNYEDGYLGLPYEDAQKLAGILTNWQKLENGVKDDMMTRVDDRYAEIGSSILAMAERLGYNQEQLSDLTDTLDNAADETKMRLYDYAINTPNITREKINEEIDKILPIYMDSGIAFKKLFRDGLKYEIVERKPTTFTFGTYGGGGESYRFNIKDAIKNNLRRISGSSESVVEMMGVTAYLTGQRNIETVSVNGKDKYRIIGQEKLYSTFDDAQIAWGQSVKDDKELQRIIYEMADEAVAGNLIKRFSNPSEYVETQGQINTLTPQE